VVVLVSLGVGLQRNATEQLGNIGDLTAIYVSPIYGEGDGPVRVVSGGGGGGPTGPSVQKLITDATLREFEAMPNVIGVIPRDWLQAGAVMRVGRLEGYGSMLGVGTNDLSILGLQPQGGVLTLEKGTVVIGSQVPLQFFDPKIRPGQEPAPPPELLGETIKLTVFKYSNDGVEIRKTLQLRVVGIIAEARNEADWSIYMPLADVTALNEWALGKRIDRNRDGYNEVLVKVDDVSHVLDVADQISAMSYQAFTPQSFVQGSAPFTWCSR
jgi:putative ABC transport system permease protein